MRNLCRRLQILERLPQFQPPPSQLQQIGRLALKQLSNEDLGIMISMTRDQEAGVKRLLLPTEAAALERQNEALEVEARRMGFRSYADAERRGR